jgi:hypothetical protein
MKNLILVSCLVGAACFLFASASRADVVLKVDGTTYDIGTVVTNFSMDAAFLEAQPEIGNVGLANDLAEAVGTSLGVSSGMGPNFPFSVESDVVFSDADISGSIQESFVNEQTVATYAVVSVVTPTVPDFSSSWILAAISSFGLFACRRYLQKQSAS